MAQSNVARVHALFNNIIDTSLDVRIMLPMNKKTTIGMT